MIQLIPSLHFQWNLHFQISDSAVSCFKLLNWNVREVHKSCSKPQLESITHELTIICRHLSWWCPSQCQERKNTLKENYLWATVIPTTTRTISILRKWRKINLPRHIRMVNETKIEGRERKCLFIILTIPSKPDLPWKLPHLKEIEIQWISENKHCLVLLNHCSTVH